MKPHTSAISITAASASSLATRPLSPPDRWPARLRVCALALGVCGLAAADPPENCEQLLTRHQRINVGSGVATERVVVAVPITIDIPIAVDPGRFGACLERVHPERGAAIRAWVDHAAECRRESQRVVHLGAPGGAARIGGGMDEHAYQSCLAGAPRIEVDIEP